MSDECCPNYKGMYESVQKENAYLKKENAKFKELISAAENEVSLLRVKQDDRVRALLDNIEQLKIEKAVAEKQKESLDAYIKALQQQCVNTFMKECMSYGKGACNGNNMLYNNFNLSHIHYRRKKKAKSFRKARKGL